MNSITLIKIVASMFSVVLMSAYSFSPMRISLDWATASEINTAGFNIYRGTSADGPFTRLNPQMIAASTDVMQGAKYHFEDRNVKPGESYFYILEDIETNGAATRHGPIPLSAPDALGALEIWLGGAVLFAAGMFSWMVSQSRIDKKLTT